jgi:hypothetical protein
MKATSLAFSAATLLVTTYRQPSRPRACRAPPVRRQRLTEAISRRSPRRLAQRSIWMPKIPNPLATDRGAAQRCAQLSDIGWYIHSGTLRRSEEGRLDGISMKNDWKRIFAFE